MTRSKTVKKDLYFTNDHERIDFQGTVTYIGVSLFSMAKINRIENLVFSKDTGFKKQGDL